MCRSGLDVLARAAVLLLRLPPAPSWPAGTAHQHPPAASCWHHPSTSTRSGHAPLPAARAGALQNVEPASQSVHPRCTHTRTPVAAGAPREGRGGKAARPAQRKGARRRRQAAAGGGLRRWAGRRCGAPSAALASVKARHSIRGPCKRVPGLAASSWLTMCCCLALCARANARGRRKRGSSAELERCDRLLGSVCRQSARKQLPGAPLAAARHAAAGGAAGVPPRILRAGWMGCGSCWTWCGDPALEPAHV